MDLIEQYRRSVAGFTERVRQVRPEQWSAPTPCTGWDVRTLVNHVVNEERWLPPIFAGATVAEVGDRFDGDLLGDDPAGNATEAAREADAAITEPGALDRIVHLSFGDFPATEYLSQVLADHLVHSWDLAAAIGADRGLDAETVRGCAEWFVEREEIYRQMGAIGPRPELPADAGEQDRLIAAFGRDPAWNAGGAGGA
ncbi:MAG: TIGR03086 family protein [Actinobacteria bacterium 13_2_20CM_2_71_6]|nr:MAG: TIGR03086 family protein [Actinobacteria bacterium 13_2_20CM_2_71_6]